MPFKASFSCLWCGTAHVVRGTGDVEGWAQLCPACVGRAGENGFLRFRLHRALVERGASTPGGKGSVGTPAGAPQATPDELDDRYLRRGRYARGPVHDAAWNAELDAAGRWLDALAINGDIVELAAGTGWWSTLLAGKGTLSVYDESPARLDRARERLVAHRLRAHLHVRDRWERPDRLVDTLFIGPELAEVPAGRLAPFLALAHAWLRPGGLFAAIDRLADPYAPSVDEAPGPAGHDPVLLVAALEAAGFSAIDVATTGRFFSLVSGRA
jgi:SAM-dependent methyltransferase